MRRKLYWFGMAALVILAVSADLTNARRTPKLARFLVDAMTMATPVDNSVVGIVQSDHEQLPDPMAIDQPLTYERVKEMVWAAIEYGHPKTGGLGTIIPQGSWVVIKPNIVFLHPQRSWRAGDTADMRVVKAVFEYVAEHTSAGRVTLAEGGSYQGLEDDRSFYASDKA